MRPPSTVQAQSLAPKKAELLPGQPIRVYVAGPYSKGMLEVNIRRVVDVAEELARLPGVVVFIPHQNFLWGLCYNHAYDFWLAQDIGWLYAAHALVRAPGESAGADREEQIARAMGIPVFYSVDDFTTWLAGENPLEVADA